MGLDDFADPRTRSKRGGRGRARGNRGGRGKGRGGRGSGQPGQGRRKGPDLGSNEFRFREREQAEDEEDFDAGVDFGEAAVSSMTNDPHFREMDHSDLGALFTADVSKISKVLETVPLWVRYGDFTKLALGVDDNDVIENYLDPFSSDDEDDVDGSNQQREIIPDEFEQALANLNFDEEVDEAAIGGVGSSSRTQSSPKDDDGSSSLIPGILSAKQLSPTDKHGAGSMAPTIVGNEAVPTSELHSKPRKVSDARSEDDRDEFDDWLDTV